MVHELNLPVKLIGIGEGVEDLDTFDSTTFVNTLFE
jgi:signal recognition particle GTPase